MFRQSSAESAYLFLKQGDTAGTDLSFEAFVIFLAACLKGNVNEKAELFSSIASDFPGCESSQENVYNVIHLSFLTVLCHLLEYKMPFI